MTEEALNTIKSQLQCFFRSTGCYWSFEEKTRKDQEWNDIEKGARVSFSTPRKSRKQKNTTAGVENFDEVIRRFRPIYTFYVIQEERPTLKSPLPFIREHTTFRGGTTPHDSHMTSPTSQLPFRN